MNNKLSCDDFRFLRVAGPDRKDIPLCVQKMMDDHSLSCQSCETPHAHQSDIDVMVSSEMEKAALELIKKLVVENTNPLLVPGDKITFELYPPTEERKNTRLVCLPGKGKLEDGVIILDKMQTDCGCLTFKEGEEYDVSQFHFMHANGMCMLTKERELVRKVYFAIPTCKKHPILA